MKMVEGPLVALVDYAYNVVVGMSRWTCPVFACREQSIQLG